MAFFMPCLFGLDPQQVADLYDEHINQYYGLQESVKADDQVHWFILFLAFIGGDFSANGDGSGCK